MTVHKLVGPLTTLIGLERWTVPILFYLFFFRVCSVDDASPLSLSLFLSLLCTSDENGGAVGSGVPRPGDATGVDLVPMRPLADLSRHFHPEHPTLPRLRSLRLFPVTRAPLSLSSLIDASPALSSSIACFRRRFVGVAFGTRGTNAILSVEHYCCDRPNPILQVIILNLSVL